MSSCLSLHLRYGPNGESLVETRPCCLCDMMNTYGSFMVILCHSVFTVRGSVFSRAGKFDWWESYSASWACQDLWRLMLGGSVVYGMCRGWLLTTCIDCVITVSSSHYILHRYCIDIAYILHTHCIHIAYILHAYCIHIAYIIALILHTIAYIYIHHTSSYVMHQNCIVTCQSPHRLNSQADIA